MNEEYSYRPEYEYRDEYPSPPEEYGSKSKIGGKSKKKRLAQLMLYSWVMLMIGGTAVVASSDEPLCDVAVYDTAGNIIIEETVPLSELDALTIPNGTYQTSSGSSQLIITDGCLSSDFSDVIETSDDGIKHIKLYQSF